MSTETQTATMDRIDLLIADPQGFTTLRVFKLVGNNLGDEMVEDEEELPEGKEPAPGGRSWVTIIQNTPEQGLWGTSLIDDLLPVSLESSIQASRYSHVLNAHMDPTLLITAKQTDLDALVTSQDVDLEGLLEDEDAFDDPPSDTVSYGEATRVARDLYRQDIAVSSSSTLRGSYVEYDGSLSNAQWFLQDFLGQARRFLTGIPQLLEESAGMPSGVAMKRILLLLWGDSSDLQDDCRVGMEAALNVPFEAPVVSIIWPDALASLDESDSMAGMMATSITQMSPMAGMMQDG